MKWWLVTWQVGEFQYNWALFNDRSMAETWHNQNRSLYSYVTAVDPTNFIERMKRLIDIAGP